MKGINLEKPGPRIAVALAITALFGLLYWLVRADVPKTLPIGASAADIGFGVLAVVFLVTSHFRPALIKVGFALAVTGLLCWAAWYLWNKVPRWLRGTEFADFSYVASLAAVFVALSLANPLLLWVWSRLGNETGEH